MDNKTLYLKTKPSKLFFKAAVPGAISMLASSLYSVFDSIFVGKFLGTTAFAALGLAMPLIVINFALADLIGVGSSVPISVFLGKGKDEEANNYFTSSSLLIVIMGLISGLLIYTVAPFIMSLMGADGELLTLSVKYIRIYACFSPLTTINFALDNYLRICGKVRTSMFLNILSSGLTIILELVFILVLGWEIEGAAFGANLSMLTVVIIATCIFLTKKNQLKYVKPKFSFLMVRTIFKNGISTFLTNIAGRVFSLVMNVMLLRFGGESAVAVYGVVMTIAGIIEQLLYGMIDSIQPSISYNYGAERIDRVKILFKYVLICGLGISFVGFLVMMIFPSQISIPFLEDLSLLGMAKFAVRVASFTYLLRWIFACIQGLFMALERPYPSMAISLCSACFFPLLLLLVYLPLQLNGLWLNYPTSALLTATLAIILFVKKKDKLFTVSVKDDKNQEISEIN